MEQDQGGEERVEKGEPLAPQNLDNVAGREGDADQDRATLDCAKMAGAEIEEPDGAAQFAELTDAVRSIEEKSGSGSSIGLFVVTIILFFSAGILQANLTHILVLIGVLFFHECGHLLAMKLLRYRDVKMFFVPFLGAAVSGRSDSGSALKSAIVSLFGPVPGVLLGSCLYLLYIPTESELILKIAQVMLILNAFNFLPIMPLDGGRMIDVLFVGHRVIRLLFALLGVLAFSGLALLDGSFLLGFVAFLGLQQALTQYRVNGIATAVRHENWQARGLSGLLERPAEMGSALLQLQERAPKLFAPRPRAVPIHNHLRLLLDTLRFRPAGTLAKVGLSLSYAVLLLLTLGLAVIFSGMNPEKKTLRMEENGKTQIIAERYLWQHKVHAVPLDVNGFYHGTGIGFSYPDGTQKTKRTYRQGRRHGEWRHYDAKGRVEEIRDYKNGELIQVRRKDGESWVTMAPHELPLYHRLLDALRSWSQPFTATFPSDHDHSTG